jgi:hypothetical protein
VHPIEVIDITFLAYVVGGVDRQTAAVQAAIAQAMSAIKDVANNAVPKSAGTMEMLLQVLSSRRSGSGPSSAPALPPTSTLTR